MADEAILRIILQDSTQGATSPPPTPTSPNPTQLPQPTTTSQPQTTTTSSSSAPQSGPVKSIPPVAPITPVASVAPVVNTAPVSPVAKSTGLSEDWKILSKEVNESLKTLTSTLKTQQTGRQTEKSNNNPLSPVLVGPSSRLIYVHDTNTHKLLEALLVKNTEKDTLQGEVDKRNLTPPDRLTEPNSSLYKVIPKYETGSTDTGPAKQAILHPGERVEDMTGGKRDVGTAPVAAKLAPHSVVLPKDLAEQTRSVSPDKEATAVTKATTELGQRKGELLTPGQEQKNFESWFGTSKVTDERGLPRTVYHGTKSKFTEFDPERAAPGVAGIGFYFAEDPRISESFAPNYPMYPNSNVQENYLSINNPFDFDSQITNEDTAKFINLLKVRFPEKFIPRKSTNYEGKVIHRPSVFDELTSPDSAGYKLPNENVTGYDLYRFIAQYGLAGDNANSILKEAGYDGITHRAGDDHGSIIQEVDNGDYGRIWIAFRPEQIKSATDNTGTFDPNNPDIRYADGTTDTGSSPQQAIVDPGERVKNLAEWFRSGVVKDEKGKPKLMYHGTPYKEFTEFKEEKLGDSEQLLYGPGFYFTDTKAIAEDYQKQGSGITGANQGQELPQEKGHLFQTYLNVRNPFDIDKDVIGHNDFINTDAAVGTDLGGFEYTAFNGNPFDSITEDEWNRMYKELAYIDQRKIAFSSLGNRTMRGVDDFKRGVRKLVDQSTLPPSLRLDEKQVEITKEILESLGLKVESDYPKHYTYSELNRQVPKKIINAALEEMGYDSITHIGQHGARGNIKVAGVDQHRVYIVLPGHASKIKSATDNIGTYDINNPDIRYETGTTDTGNAPQRAIVDPDERIHDMSGGKRDVGPKPVVANLAPHSVVLPKDLAEETRNVLPSQEDAAIALAIEELKQRKGESFARYAEGTTNTGDQSKPAIVDPSERILSQGDISEPDWKPTPAPTGKLREIKPEPPAPPQMAPGQRFRKERVAEELFENKFYKKKIGNEYVVFNKYTQGGTWDDAVDTYKTEQEAEAKVKELNEAVLRKLAEKKSAESIAQSTQPPTPSLVIESSTPLPSAPDLFSPKLKPKRQELTAPQLSNTTPLSALTNKNRSLSSSLLSNDSIFTKPLSLNEEVLPSLELAQTPEPITSSTQSTIGFGFGSVTTPVTPVTPATPITPTTTVTPEPVTPEPVTTVPTTPAASVTSTTPIVSTTQQTQLAPEPYGPPPPDNKESKARQQYKIIRDAIDLANDDIEVFSSALDGVQTQLFKLRAGIDPQLIADVFSAGTEAAERLLDELTQIDELLTGDQISQIERLLLAKQAIAGAAVQPEPPLAEPPPDLIQSLIDVPKKALGGMNPHVLLEGETGSGKSLLAKHIAFQRMQQGQKVHVVDTHTPEAWGGAEQVFQGDDAGTDAASFLKEELAGRKRQKAEVVARGEKYDPELMTVVFSDFARLMKDTPELAKEFATLLTEARKFGISVVADTTTLTRAATGIEGVEDVIKNFGQKVKLYAPTPQGDPRRLEHTGKIYETPQLPDYQDRIDPRLIQLPKPPPPPPPPPKFDPVVEAENRREIERKAAKERQQKRQVDEEYRKKYGDERSKSPLDSVIDISKEIRPLIGGGLPGQLMSSSLKIMSAISKLQKESLPKERDEELISELTKPSRVSKLPTPELMEELPTPELIEEPYGPPPLGEEEWQALSEEASDVLKLRDAQQAAITQANVQPASTGATQAPQAAGQSQQSSGTAPTSVPPATQQNAAPSSVNSSGDNPPTLTEIPELTDKDEEKVGAAESKLTESMSATEGGMASMAGVVSVAATALIELGKVTISTVHLMDGAVKQLGNFDARLATASAMAEVRQIYGDLRRSQEASPVLTSFTNARSDFDQRSEDLKIEFIKLVGPAVTELVSIASIVVGNLAAILRVGNMALDLLTSVPLLAELLDTLKAIWEWIKARFNWFGSVAPVQNDPLQVIMGNLFNYGD